MLNSAGDVIAEVFRNDSKNTINVTLFIEEVPFDAMQSFLKEAWVVFQHFEDGSPLESAKNFGQYLERSR